MAPQRLCSLLQLQVVFGLVLTLQCVLVSSSTVSSHRHTQHPRRSRSTNISSQSDLSDRGSCETLYLLNVVPFPAPSGISTGSWDGGYQVIPAGRVAAKHINNRSDILSGHELRLIDVDSEACGTSTITKGVVNLYENLVYRPESRCVVAIVGLYCSPVTSVIAPIASHPNLDYVSLASSTASDHRDLEKFPQLFHVIASFEVIQEAVVSMMKEFNWKRVGIANDNMGSFFYSSANTFAKRIETEPDFELVTHISIQHSPDNISETFEALTNRQARISFWSVSTEQSAHIMCKAYTENLLWDGYVYIFHAHSLAEILDTHTACSQGEMVQATEGIFLVNNQLASDPSDTLISGFTYEEYYTQYEEELRDFATETGTNITAHEWANALYDQVWAFALALNNTLEINNTFDKLFLGRNSAVFSDNIINYLEQMPPFQGATGRVYFGKDHDVRSSIVISQVRNATAVHIGTFSNGSFTLLDQDMNIPKDEFQTVYSLVPMYMWIPICAFQGVLFVLITFNLVLFFWWRTNPVIKATSPQLTLLMFVGCYFLCVAPVTQTIYRSILIENATCFAILCNLEVWLTLNGTNVIFATLFLRLLRIFHIFRVFRKTSKYWSDRYIFLYILLICSVQVVILALWSGIDPLYRNDTDKLKYIPSAHPPYYEVTAICVSKNLGIWMSISFAYSGLIFLMVVFLAIQTRHIKRQAFKDTKKVNIYIFTITVIVAVTIPLQYLFSTIGVELLAYVLNWLACFSVPFFCQVLLFSPKILPLFFECVKLKSRNVCSRYTTSV